MISYFFLNVLQEFFGQLDQRVLNAFLKACDELTDILPEQEQQNLQETVRKLHKQWKVREHLHLLTVSPHNIIHLCSISKDSNIFYLSIHPNYCKIILEIMLTLFQMVKHSK